MKKLPIIFDSSFRLASFGDDPSAYTLLSLFFKDYIQIVDKDSYWIRSFSKRLKTHNLGKYKLGRTYTRRLVDADFIETAHKLKDYEFLIHAPVNPPYKINPLRFIMNSPALSLAYENKLYFRDEFSDTINIPDYKVKSLLELKQRSSFQKLFTLYPKGFVLQETESSGSLGTFIIFDEKQYFQALKTFSKDKNHESVIISEYIKGDSASIQVCITKYGVLTSGIQKQLVNDSSLCNPLVQNVNKWCGGELDAIYSRSVQKQAQHIARKVGAELSSNGYKGIFGIDLMITELKKVYAIEVNARLTGFSHVLSEQQMKSGQIPFLLLHVLELANVHYKVLDLDALPGPEKDRTTSTYLILMNQLKKSFRLSTDIDSGVYVSDSKQLKLIRKANSATEIKQENELLILSPLYSKGDVIRPGERILKIFKLGSSVQDEKLDDETRELIDKIKVKFDIPGLSEK